MEHWSQHRRVEKEREREEAWRVEMGPGVAWRGA